MEKSAMERYAALLVDACMGLKEGDRIRIVGEAPARPFMLVLAETAYRRGARQVRFEYPDPSLERIFADNVREDWVEDLSALVKREADCLVEEGWSYLRLLGEERPGILEGADSSRLQRSSRVRSKARKNLMEAQMSNRLIWCVAPLPTAAWGRRVFQDAGRKIPDDPEAALLGELLPILRLDAADPGAAVLSHAKEIEARAKRLDALALAELHFKGPGTDLRVGLSRRSRWVGGGSKTPDGRYFLANHPSEEVFSSPDARLTEGRASCTRPVEVLGAKVEGAWFEFKGGEVVDFGAAENRASLERYFQIEPNAKRLGEVALVDGSGPIFKKRPRLQQRPHRRERRLPHRVRRRLRGGLRGLRRHGRGGEEGRGLQHEPRPHRLHDRLREGGGDGTRRKRK